MRGVAIGMPALEIGAVHFRGQILGLEQIFDPHRQTIYR